MWKTSFTRLPKFLRRKTKLLARVRHLVCYVVRIVANQLKRSQFYVTAHQCFLFCLFIHLVRDNEGEWFICEWLMLRWNSKSRPASPMLDDQNVIWFPQWLFMIDEDSDAWILVDWLWRPMSWSFMLKVDEGDVDVHEDVNGEVRCCFRK